MTNDSSRFVPTVDFTAPPWTYRQRSRFASLLARPVCALVGHRWWYVVRIWVCSRCGGRR